MSNEKIPVCVIESEDGTFYTHSKDGLWAALLRAFPCRVSFESMTLEEYQSIPATDKSAALFG